MWHLLMPISVNLEVCLLKSFLVVSSSFFLSIFLSFSFFFWGRNYYQPSRFAGIYREINRILQKQLKLLNQVLIYVWRVLLPHNKIKTGTTQRGHNSCDNDTISSGSSNLQRHLSVSETTEAWATLQGSSRTVNSTRSYIMFLSTYDSVSFNIVKF